MTRRAPRVAVAAYLLCTAAALSAQDSVPFAGWRAVPDPSSRSGAAASVDRMPPGWHVTTGPGVSLVHPRLRVDGRFTLETEAFLFPGTSAGGYGLFVSAADLEGERRSYVAFLVRRDGSAAVVRRHGGAETFLHAWTRADSLAPHPGSGTVRAVLVVAAEPDSVTFSVNGGRVATVARASVGPDGAFGVRVEPDVNLHVSRLDVTLRLAPPRR